MAIAVIIPVYNGAAFLAEAIDSVLAQNDLALDILVVDDGSNDESAAIASRYAPRVRLVRQENRGAAAARNAGVAATASASDFIAFLDADDVWTPGKLAKQLAAFTADTSLDMVFGHALQFIEGSNGPETTLPAYLPSAMLVRRPAFERVGGFSSDVGMGELIDWYGRAMDLGLRSAMLPDVLMRRRIHATNQGVVKRDRYAKDYLRILKQTRDRRRAK